MPPETSLASQYAAPAAVVEAPREQIIAGSVYLTHEAARVLRCQPSTIRHAIRTGTIRGKGRPYRILGSELFKLV